MPTSDVSFDEVLAKERQAHPGFWAEWQRFAPARQFAVALLRYRTENGIGQRALATQLGVSQPRIAKLESGEHNPDIDTIINAVRQLGIEFCLDVAPAGRKPVLVTARARKCDVIDHNDVAVVAASAHSQGR
jgi:DNA-binding XRE family transcriptional regulator